MTSNYQSYFFVRKIKTSPIYLRLPTLKILFYIENIKQQMFQLRFLKLSNAQPMSTKKKDCDGLDVFVYYGLKRAKITSQTFKIYKTLHTFTYCQLITLHTKLDLFSFELWTWITFFFWVHFCVPEYHRKID